LREFRWLSVFPGSEIASRLDAIVDVVRSVDEISFWEFQKAYWKTALPLFWMVQKASFQIAFPMFWLVGSWIGVAADLRHLSEEVREKLKERELAAVDALWELVLEI
jgi:hypothetical protein